MSQRPTDAKMCREIELLLRKGYSPKAIGNMPGFPSETVVYRLKREIFGLTRRKFRAERLAEVNHEGKPLFRIWDKDAEFIIHGEKLLRAWKLHKCLM